MIGRGVAPASALTHARILLKANQGEAGPGWTDAAIGAALEVNPATVARVRMRYVAAGLEAAIYRKPPARAVPPPPGRPAGSPVGRSDLLRPTEGRAGPCGCWPTGWSRWASSIRSPTRPSARF